MPCTTRVSVGSASLANIDAPIEIRELHFRAAATYGSVDGLVDLDAILAAILPAILDGLLWHRSLNLDIEITENFSAIGFEAEIGF